MTEKAMKNKALVVIDIQNDITKHYRDIIGNINSAIEWAVVEEMHVIYIKHNNITALLRGRSNQVVRVRSCYLR